MNRDYKTPAGTAPPDWRGLCEELYRAFTAHARTDKQHDLLDRVQGALAQSEPEVAGPTDEELLHITTTALSVGDIKPAEIKSETELYLYGCEVAKVARAAIAADRARYGRPAQAPPPEPEVVGPSDEEWGALVDRLWDQYETVGYQGERFMYEGDFSTALDLVRQKIARCGRPAPAPAGERQAAPVPVAVSERLPGAEDCDALGACWWYAEEYGWELQHREHPLSECTHWLPFSALPLPSTRSTHLESGNEQPDR